MITTQLARAEASSRYGAHLVAAGLRPGGPPSRPRAIGLMACEHLRLALVFLEVEPGSPVDR